MLSANLLSRRAPRVVAFCVFIINLIFSAVPALAGGTYPKIEASFNLTGLSADPVVLFDYVQTDVKVAISQPDSSTVILPAFYDSGTTWRVRHTPFLPGNYTITSITVNGSPASFSNLSPSNWVVTGFPNNAGYVRVDPANPRRFITSNGRRFFPVGENMAWSSPGANAVNIFAKLGAAHANWSRVWMTHFYEGSGLGLNLDWPKVSNFGQLSLPNAQHWDAIVAAADQAGIHFQMALQHHGQYSTSTDPNWVDNPYNTANGGFLSNPTNFFTDATAKMYTKRKFRYIIARWGYSPGIMAWELFNEVQFTTAAQSGHWDIVGAWHDEMALFLKSQDPYQHLVTTSSEISRPIWNQTDYYQHHDYPSDLITTLRDAADISVSQPVAPVFSGECGTNGVPHYGLNAPLWSGLMAGQSGNAQPWWWDTTDVANDYIYFRAVSDFVTSSGLADQDVLAKSSPHVTGGPLGSLPFAPGGGFETNKGPDVFTVGSAAPDGIGAATAYLQGDGNRSLLTNGYTFFVNYPSNGTFSVRISQVSACGGTLQILLDGVEKTNVNFPANATCGTTFTAYNTNRTPSISVPAGAHIIKVANPGADWLRLGNITLNPYAPQLGGYAIGNSAFKAIWLWHRTNVFLANASVTRTGTVDIVGLNTGTYSATWWDTFGAGAISNFTFTVTDTNVPVTLATPPVLRSIALYAGLPAQAGIISPDLTQTVASNSPPFILPLVITNGGGLPLAYSLSVTGANTAWLSVSSTNGFVPKSGVEIVQLGFNPAGRAVGTYNATLVINTSDSLLPVTALPVSLTIFLGLDAWRQANFGTTNNIGIAADTADPDNDGLANLLEYAFGQNPNIVSPQPWSFDFINSHLTVTFTRPRPASADITYLVEVTTDLASGLWDSGPAFTSENITDNGDGTETVVITDLSGPPAPDTHFLRLRVTKP